VITGPVTSDTVTVAAHVASPARFSAVIVTMYVPGPTIDPAAGDWESVTLQPVATTSGTRFGIAASHSASTDRVLFVAHAVIVGALAGTTVTVKSQFEPDALVQVTRVVPVGKTVPEPGLQVTEPQSPVVDGA
jgi:hypothetical protein